MVTPCDIRYLLIANPTSGKGRCERMAKQVRAVLKEAGAEALLELTSARGDAESIATQALADSQDQGERRLCVVACGGDGTVQEVVNALLARGERRGLLGIVPGGRCNDFASALGIGRDLPRIARTLLAGRARGIDVGRINDRYFCTVAARGCDAAVSRFVNDVRLPISSTTAYVLGTLRVLCSFKPVSVRLTFDDATFEGEVFLVASANTTSYGGKLRIAPEADPCDGLLDVCIVSRLSRLRGLHLLQRVLRARHGDLPEVRFVRTRSLKIEPAEAREIWADGELVDLTPAVIECVPRAIDVLAP